MPRLADRQRWDAVFGSLLTTLPDEKELQGATAIYASPTAAALSPQQGEKAPTVDASTNELPKDEEPPIEESKVDGVELPPSLAEDHPLWTVPDHPLWTVPDHPLWTVPAIVVPPPVWWGRGAATVPVEASLHVSVEGPSSSPPQAAGPVAAGESRSPQASSAACALSSPQPSITTPPTNVSQTSFSYSTTMMQTSGLVPGGHRQSIAAAPACVLAAPDPSDAIAVGVAALRRPKAFRVRNKKMKCFVSDPNFLKLIGSSRPLAVQLQGGIAALDLIAAVLRHVRQTYAAALEGHRQWLNEAHFHVEFANADGSADEDIRMVLTGDRVVDNEYVLLAPRPEYAAYAFASHARCSNLPAVRLGVVHWRVEARHTAGGDTADGGATRVHAVAVFLDLTVRQLPEFLCSALFLSEPSASTGGGVSIEEESLALRYDDSDVPVSRALGFGADDGPPRVSVLNLTVGQMAQAGVVGASFTTSRPPPARLKGKLSPAVMSMETLSAAGASDEASSVAERASVVSGATAADLWRVSHMDDIEALAYRTYSVRKRNERKVWQHRLFSVDKDFIYNQKPDEQTGATKRPMRRIVDVDNVVVSPEDPKHCEVRYTRGSGTGVGRDELEFESASECKHFATKIRILQRVAAQSTTSPARLTAGPVGESSPSNPIKRTVSQRFLSLFK